MISDYKKAQDNSIQCHADEDIVNTQNSPESSLLVFGSIEPGNLLPACHFLLESQKRRGTRRTLFRFSQPKRFVPAFSFLKSLPLRWSFQRSRWQVRGMEKLRKRPHFTTDTFSFLRIHSWYRRRRITMPLEGGCR